MYARERHRLGPGDVEDAAHAGHRARARSRARRRDWWMTCIIGSKPMTRRRWGRGAGSSTARCARCPRMCTGRRMTVSVSGQLPEEALREHVDLDEIADVAEVLRRRAAARPRSETAGCSAAGRRRSRSRGRRAWARWNCATYSSSLREAGDVPRVVLGRGRARIVHDAEVHDGLDVAGAEDVLELLAADVDLGVLDVLGLVEEGAAIDADDGALAVKHARELLARGVRRCP